MNYQKRVLYFGYNDDHGLGRMRWAGAVAGGLMTGMMETSTPPAQQRPPQATQPPTQMMMRHRLPPW